MLPPQGTWVQFLVRDLRSCVPHGTAKKKKKRQSCHGILERALEGLVCLFKSTFPFHKHLGWAHFCHLTLSLRVISWKMEMKIHISKSYGKISIRQKNIKEIWKTLSAIKIEVILFLPGRCQLLSHRAGALRDQHAQRPLRSGPSQSV